MGTQYTTSKGRGYQYVGMKIGGGRERFTAWGTPTRETHGDKYAAVIGPFRTVRGAKYMEAYGSHDNPHLQHVDDAERYAAIEARIA